MSIDCTGEVFIIVYDHAFLGQLWCTKIAVFHKYLGSKLSFLILSLERRSIKCSSTCTCLSHTKLQL